MNRYSTRWAAQAAATATACSEVNLLSGMRIGRRPIAQITRQLPAPLPVLSHRVERSARAVVQHRLIDVSKPVIDAVESRPFQLAPALLPPLFSPVISLGARLAHVGNVSLPDLNTQARDEPLPSQSSGAHSCGKLLERIACAPSCDAITGASMPPAVLGEPSGPCWPVLSAS